MFKNLFSFVAQLKFRVNLSRQHADIVAEDSE